MAARIKKLSLMSLVMSFLFTATTLRAQDRDAVVLFIRQFSGNPTVAWPFDPRLLQALHLDGTSDEASHSWGSGEINYSDERVQMRQGWFSLVRAVRDWQTRGAVPQCFRSAGCPLTVCSSSRSTASCVTAHVRFKLYGHTEEPSVGERK